jgi:hypothetical protein
MKRALTNLPSWVASLAALAATVPSCGSGIHDGEGEVYAKETIDDNGGRIVLREAVLDIPPRCVAGPTPITLRRYAAIDNSGAISPVFQLEIPTAKTFVDRPQLSIVASSEISSGENSALGHLLPDGHPQLWIPEQPRASVCDLSSSVCSLLQLQAFTDPPTTSKLDYAIVKLCNASSDCLPNQSCQSGACQYCPTCGS